MWFRNARVFRFTKPFDISAEELEEKLQADAFKPCGPQETSRQGWVPPLGKHGEQLVHSANGYHLIALRKEEKILPGPVVKEAVEEKAEAIEFEQGRKVRRKEKDEIKEQVMLEMLPQAFSKNRRSFAYLAPRTVFWWWTRVPPSRRKIWPRLCARASDRCRFVHPRWNWHLLLPLPAG